MQTIIHINRHIIAANKKNNETNPPITVKTYKSTRYCMEVNIKGESSVVYRPEKPLSCGAAIWIKTQAEVELIGEADAN